MDEGTLTLQDLGLTSRVVARTLKAAAVVEIENDALTRSVCTTPLHAWASYCSAFLVDLDRVCRVIETPTDGIASRPSECSTKVRQCMAFIR
jgi:hypothetical protein